MTHASSGIALADRVKQLSYTTGTSNYSLDSNSQGFSPFGDLYSSGDVVFYAATDGTDYEIGSGVYHYLASGPDELDRTTLVSTNSNASVDWGVGIKEVFVTYPADFAVYTAGGLGPYFKEPAESGIAFWETPNILNYDTKLVWEGVSGFLGISNDSPLHAIDIGGSAAYSHIRASGATVSSSGISFPSGRQTLPFFANDLIDGDGTENTNIGDVIQLSGTVDEYVGFKRQAAGSVLAGPPSGCGPGCSPEYPSFRHLTKEDIPSLVGGSVHNYVRQQGDASKSGVPYFYESGIIAYDDAILWNPTDNRLGINYGTLAPHALSVSGDAMVSGTLYVSSIDGLAAGSGLELGGFNNLTFNVGNVYNVAVSGSSAAVSQADTVVVSGVSGVNTTMSSDGVTHTIFLDPTELSGALSSQITGSTYTAGSGLDLAGLKFNVMQANSVVQDADNLPSGGAIFNFGSGISGVLNTKIDTVSGNIEVSGASPSSGVRIVNQYVMLEDPKTPNLDFLASGSMDVVDGGDRLLVWDQSETKWEWTYLNDLNHKFGSAAGGQTNEYGWKYITVSSGDNLPEWNFAGTSNIAATSTIDKLNLVAGSGVILNTDVANSGLRIAASGYHAGSGLELVVNPTNRNYTFNAASGDLDTSGIVRLWDGSGDTGFNNTSFAATPSSIYALSGYVIYASGFLNDQDLAISGHLASQSYWNGRLFADSGLYFPSGNFAQFGGPTSAGGAKTHPHQGQVRSVVMGRYASTDTMGNSNIDSVIIGHRAAVSAVGNSGIVSIGESAGYEADTNTKSVFIGTGAGSGIQNAANVICIGEEAGHDTNDVDGAIMIGKNTGGYLGRHSVYIGNNAGRSLGTSGNIEIIAGTNADNEVAGLTSSKENMVNIGGVITGNWADRQLIIGSGGTDPTATLDIYPATNSTVGVIVSGVKAHSVDLQQWRVQDSNDVQTTRLSVDHSGILVFNDAIPSANAPVDSIFVDSANNKFTFKNNAGATIQLEAAAAAVTTYTPPAVTSFTGSSGTLGITTALSGIENQYVRCQYNSSEPYITINVPYSGFYSPSIGTEFIFEQDSGVNISVLPSGANVLVNSAYTRTSAGQYSVISIKKVDNNTWTLTGDLQ
tara:strand:+ start:2927 stop:6277 length:3351 start_codon:yes stop_codon:yes gene_type:complete